MVMDSFKSVFLKEFGLTSRCNEEETFSEADRASPFMQLLGPELHHSLSVHQSLRGPGKYSMLADEIPNDTTHGEMKIWLLKSLDIDPKLRFCLAQKLQQNLGPFRKDLLIIFNGEIDEDPIAADWIQSANKYVQLPLQGKFPVKNSGSGDCGFCCVSQVLTGTYVIELSVSPSFVTFIFTGTEKLVEELRIRVAIYLILNQKESQKISKLHNWYYSSLISGCFEDEVKECLVGWITAFSWHALAMVVNCPIHIWQPKVSEGRVIQFEQPANARFNPWASLKDAIQVLRINSSGSLSEKLDHYVLLKNKPAPLVTLDKDSNDEEEVVLSTSMTINGDTSDDDQNNCEEIVMVEFLQTTKGYPLAYLQGYYFIKHRPSGNRSWAYRCEKCNKRCRARIKIQLDGICVSRGTAEHNHEPDYERKHYLKVSTSKHFCESPSCLFVPICITNLN